VDLVIRGGLVVTAASSTVADVGISDGEIAQIGGAMQGREVIAAEGKIVVPGGVDMHVHLTPAVVREGSFEWVDDFHSGSRAAAAGGITTLGNMTFPRPGESLVAALERTRREVAGLSIVDFVLHPVLAEASETNLGQIAALPAAGSATLKIFMILSGFAADPGGFIRAMREAAKAGILTMVHCEDGGIISFLVERLIEEGLGSPSNYAQTRPVYSEAAAVSRAIAFAEATGAPVYLVHVSSRQALEVAQRARSRGLPVFLETRPEYLHFTLDEVPPEDRLLFAGSPPLREADDREALWDALRTGEIQTCCSDHAPWQRSQKLAATELSRVLNGLAELDTMLPILFSEGVRRNRLSLSQFVNVTATNAARLFGLYPRKGEIAKGADADVVVWDPAARRTVRAKGCFSRCDYTIYEGWEVEGWPQYTISRGEVVFAEGRILGQPGRGKPVRMDRHFASEVLA
jgi:dihydropyrimidinase